MPGIAGVGVAAFPPQAAVRMATAASKAMTLSAVRFIVAFS
jgi:hypothetical protein